MARFIFTVQYPVKMSYHVRAKLKITPGTAGQKTLKGRLLDYLGPDSVRKSGFEVARDPVSWESYLNDAYKGILDKIEGGTLELWYFKNRPSDILHISSVGFPVAGFDFRAGRFVYSPGIDYQRCERRKGIMFCGTGMTLNSRAGKPDESVEKIVLAEFPHLAGRYARI
jgi:hypothetical protein